MSRQLLVTAGSLGLAQKNISAVGKVYSQLGHVSLDSAGSKSSQLATCTAKPKKVAFIGLGAMGLGMANGKVCSLSELMPSSSSSGLQRQRL